jgi:hypothetical protein
MKAEELFRKFAEEVYKATKNKGWDGIIDEDSNKHEELQWSFAGSMLFSVTVITTIGGLLVELCLTVSGLALTNKTCRCPKIIFLREYCYTIRMIVTMTKLRTSTVTVTTVPRPS